MTGRLLSQTAGNLYVLNIVNRIGAYSDTEQVRLASNTHTMADSIGLHMAPDGSWNDPTGQHRNQHAIAEPLTGAVFDCLVELYQDGLAARGLIAPEMDARGWTRDDVERSMDGGAHRFRRRVRTVRTGVSRGVGRRAARRGAMHGARDPDGAAGDAEFSDRCGAFSGGGGRAGADTASAGAARSFPVAWDRSAAGAGDCRATGARQSAPTPRGEPRGRLYVAEVPNPGPDRACCDPWRFIAARRRMPHAHRTEPE